MIRLLLVAILTMAALSVQARGLLVLGESISAAYGIEKSAGWVALLEKELEQRCRDFPVINASVSGETTAGGNSRLVALLEKHAPQILIIELGGNDGLRGLSPIAMGNNLAQMIEKSRAADATPILLGMRIPPNYGPSIPVCSNNSSVRYLTTNRCRCSRFFWKAWWSRVGCRKMAFIPPRQLSPC